MKSTKTNLVLLAGAMAFAGSLSQAAVAPDVAPTAVPQLAGTYLVHITGMCGVPANPWPNGVATGFDGGYQVTIGTLAFNNTTKQANFTGSNFFTQLIVPNSSGGNAGTNSNDFSGAYSVTASTVSIAGVTYQAVFGKTAKGIAQHFEFAYVSTANGVSAPNCVTHGAGTIISAS
jgi:hypothetical protein